MFTQILPLHQTGGMNPKFDWALRACAALCFPFAAFYCVLFFATFSGSVTRLLSDPSARPEHFLAQIASLMFVVAFALASIRLFALRRWATLVLAAFGWFSTFNMLGTFSSWSLDLWMVLLVLSVTLILTAAIVIHWQRLERGI